MRTSPTGKAWDKRVEQWGREQAAREQLLQVTLEGRKLQVSARATAPPSRPRTLEREAQQALGLG
jgi:hypothetical protein